MKKADFAKDENIRLDVMKHFGYYSTESNGHLSEYLMWYRKRPEEMAEEKDKFRALASAAAKENVT